MKRCVSVPIAADSSRTSLAFLLPMLPCQLSRLSPAGQQERMISVTEGNVARRSLPSGSSMYARRLALCSKSRRPTPAISREIATFSAVAAMSGPRAAALVGVEHDLVRLPARELPDLGEVERHQRHDQERLRGLALGEVRLQRGHVLGGDQRA